MAQAIEVVSPFEPQVIEKLKAGDRVSIRGVLYGMRDAAHKRLIEALKSGREVPIPLKGQTIYYVGPSPTPPGKIIGSAGPTTSGRMDRYTIPLLEAGIKATIGKGSRSLEVREAMKRHKAIYLATIGGAGALLSKYIKKVEVVAYPELGPEAIFRLEVEDFPAIVINDIHGGNLYEEGIRKYQRK